MFKFFKKHVGFTENSNISSVNKDEQSKITGSIVKLKTAATTEDKIAIAKQLLAETDVVRSGDVLVQFDDERWAREQNFLRKYLEYKSANSLTYREADRDVSFLCIVMYTLLDSYLNQFNIVNQYGSELKYEIRRENIRYKGDTLIPELYILKLYLGSLWRRIDANESLLQIKRLKDFHELFSKIAARTGIPVAPSGDWCEYCYKHSDIIWNAMDEEAKMFLKNNNMFGNYMCIPGCSYRVGEKKWTSFNMARSNMGKWDTVDTLLCKLYGFYQYSDISFIADIFTEKQDELTAETLKWLNHFSCWKDFLEKNALSSFVDRDTMIPISLKTGRQISIHELKSYDAIPSNYQEFLVFFKQSAERIALRSQCIYSKISGINQSC